jgi:outer membrane receptor for ferrienterochelin and colicins
VKMLSDGRRTVVGVPALLAALIFTAGPVAAATPPLLADGTAARGAALVFATDTVPDAGRVVGVVTAGTVRVAFAQLGVRGYAVRAVADGDGRYSISGLEPGSYTLLVSAVGYGTMEVPVTIRRGETVLRDVELDRQVFNLNPMVVTATRKQTFVSESPVKVDVVPARYLQMLATSNLVEAIGLVNGLSQQVDCAVCYTNSIRINGMEGQYTSVLIDGMPIMSSLASVYGLNGINPALIERIEVIKGPSSTLYGSDAMAGVINVITKDARFAPRIALDLQATDHGVRNAEIALAPRLGRMNALLSGSFYQLDRFLDGNDDGFSDLTLDTRVALFGKVQSAAARGRGLSLAAKYYYEDRFGGEREWTRADRGSDTIYGEHIETSRFELLGSWGLPLSSQDVRVEFSGTLHDQDAYYADSRYAAQQRVGVAQLIWDVSVGQRHDLLVGAGLRTQYFDDESPATLEPVVRTTPGIFVQDEYSASRRLKLLGGLRLDGHADHGAIVSPRASVKFEPYRETTLRLNAGTGFRVVDLFTEDYAVLTHTRRLVTADDLDPERSYSLTLNVNQVIDFDRRPMMVDVDAFYTHFTNRIIPDYDSDPSRITYTNLDGYGVTRGIGVSLNQNFGIVPFLYTLGFTVQDVFYEDGGERENEMFAASFRGSWSASYMFEGLGLTLDYAGQVVGPMRLPAYDEPFARPVRSATYTLHNIIGTVRRPGGLEVYAGVRNLFDFTQPSPIVDAANPFSENFDASWVYGPVHGRNIMAGIRYVLGR